MDNGGSCIPVSGAVVGDRTEGRAGEDPWCLRIGLWLGVGGTSDAGNVVLSKAGVWMVKLLGLRRPVFIGPLRGDVGAEKAWRPSVVDETVCRAFGALMLSDRFLTLRSLLAGDSDRG